MYSPPPTLPVTFRAGTEVTVSVVAMLVAATHVDGVGVAAGDIIAGAAELDGGSCGVASLRGSGEGRARSGVSDCCAEDGTTLSVAGSTM